MLKGIRLKQIVSWLTQGKYHLLNIAFFIITALYLFRFLDFYPNAVALSMSLTGLFIILGQQTLDADKFSSHKPNTLLNWIKSFPKSKSVIIAIHDTAIGICGMKAHATVSISADATIDEKVEFLLRQVESLNLAIVKLDDKLDEVKSSLDKGDKELQTSIDNLNKSFNTLIAGHVIGSYDLNMFGVIITICGTLIQFAYS